jgi:transcriptional regulator with PAS, ATPase and Fis domain
MYNIKNHNEIIKKSFERSESYGVKKEKIEQDIISESEIAKIIEKNSNLIKMASTFIDIIYNFLEGSEFFIVLTDKDGYILIIKGDKDIVEAARDTHMCPGFCMDEKCIGTNAIGTAIKENIPIQISAAEHFINLYHRWTCSAAPIHDENGNIIGALNLTGSTTSVHPHTLGLVAAAVKSIEYSLQSEKTRKELFETYEYINTMIHAISSGILAVDAGGNVKFINKSACNMLNVNVENIINKHVGNYLKNWNEIFTILEGGMDYQNEELVIDRGNISERYIINARPIRTKDNSIIGMVVVLNEMQKVFNIANKYTGKRSEYTFDDIIGCSNQIKKVIEFAKAIANSPSTVLIQGESGTGKEILAQSIHNYSERRDYPFVAINCGAIPKNLIESELFGYEDGAFTGARKGGHPGKFEIANGGTIFLDEIGEMPLDMQVDLLRVLQEGCITRVGGSKNIQVNARVIAATNKELKEEIIKGNFRQDLYYRLSVIPIDIPPLRERKDDIPPLIYYFLNKKASKLTKNVPQISSELYKKLIDYNWPGNVRELENVIENIVNFNGKTTYNIDNFKIIEGTKAEENIEFKKYSDMTLEEIEKNAIILYLNKYNSNITKAANALGISRNTLYCKIKKYSIKTAQSRDSVLKLNT